MAYEFLCVKRRHPYLAHLSAPATERRDRGQRKSLQRRRTPSQRAKADIRLISDPAFKFPSFGSLRAAGTPGVQWVR